MKDKDPFAHIVIKQLATSLRPWVEEVNKLGLWAVSAPDGTELVIFNDDHLERGCLLIKADGEIIVGWQGEIVTLTPEQARQHMQDNLLG